MTGTLAVYLSVLGSLLSGAAPTGYLLTVEVENVRNAQGVVGVLVFLGIGIAMGVTRTRQKDPPA